MGTQVVAFARYALSAALRYVPVDPAANRTVLETSRQMLLSGTAVTVPFIVTLAVLGVVVDFVANMLAPFAHVLLLIPFLSPFGTGVAMAITAGLLLAVVFVAGVLAETESNTGIGTRAGRLMESIPGVGSVYTSFDRMSEVMFEADSESFREVKLIEFPHAGLYSLAFQTAEVSEDDGEEGMLVLFVPLAPNPVMGGFMVCVPEDQVRDVDMTVQEAFQAIVTSGVAMTDTPGETVSAGMPGGVTMPDAAVGATGAAGGGPSPSESP